MKSNILDLGIFFVLGPIFGCNCREGDYSYEKPII